MATRPDHDHAGRCTDGPLFTRDQAVARLTEMGYRFHEVRADFYRGDPGSDNWDRGRLAWAPDFCDTDNTHPNTGTRFWLRRPYDLGTVEVLP